MIIAIEDGTSLTFRVEKNCLRKVDIPVGYGVAFRTDRIHCGSEYGKKGRRGRQENRRIFCMFKRKLHVMERNSVHHFYECEKEGCDFECFGLQQFENHMKNAHED